MDGYFGYNQVRVNEADQFKTSFTTKWGTMAYKKMPFGLSNAGATFQKAMEDAFQGLLYDFLLVYLDDVIIFSKSIADHLLHLRQVFERCKEFNISLIRKRASL